MLSCWGHMELINEICSDYSAYCCEKLDEEFGSHQLESYDPIYLYQRYKVRLIEVRERNVLEPEGIVVPAGFLDAYDEIKDDIENGRPLKKYQSRKLKTLDYDDDMLSHWAIQHFHLGQQVESDGFVKRTGKLLFVHFSKNEAHILGFFDHGAWSNTDLIEIIHNNWPYCLSVYKAEDGSPALTEVQIKNLRNKNSNSNVTVSDGTEYLSPGFGVMSNGAPMIAILNSRRVVHMFDQYFEVIKANIDSVLEADANGDHGSSVTIGMNAIQADGDVSFVIKETGFVFRLQS